MINIGDTLILEPKYSSEHEKYKCKLVERNGEQLYIDYPVSINTGKTVFLLDGTQFKGSFVGKDNTVYLFETEVQGRTKQQIPMIAISYPGNENLIRVQRRQYVRVDTPVDVAVHPIEGQFSPFVTITSDISAGGAALILPPNVKLESDTIIDLWVVLPMQSGDYHNLVLRSRVIRVIPGQNGERDKMPIEFLSITESQRQLLIRFSFERQLNLKRKGL
ncbi:flagellar brake protein [Bacillus suaedaesalsae]|uniref:Flagellar brake domain-containing protein n=1 Tax=Bacillus suaedaesalsae TaxID=2810349 RepID=A0ABS2DND1_9BACI|nr:flagellar brake domain-containing protein [Bacillus suaedaesalsae]MBM6619887.1 flagellar brake domain-containing protein [Bacillus suaedaesalsae]